MINIKANYSKRTFTIRKQNANGRTVANYRTNTLSVDEFNELDYNTTDDWMHFLNTSLYYYQVS